jgi:hypothetical protein
MDFIKDKKNAPIVIAAFVLAIGGAIGSCVHFMSGPPPIVPMVAPIGSPLIKPPGDESPSFGPVGAQDHGPGGFIKPYTGGSAAPQSH